MKACLLTSDQFTTTDWSGGKTTQLYLYPEGAHLADRDFRFRISSASFSTDHSVFSDFTGYQRYLLPLVGQIGLAHYEKPADQAQEQSAPPAASLLYRRSLAPYQADYFLGHWLTQSTNSLDCRDFNFIVRSGAQAQLALLEKAACYLPKRQGLLLLYAQEGAEVLLGDQVRRLPAQGLLRLEEKAALYRILVLSAPKPVVVCEYRD